MTHEELIKMINSQDMSEDRRRRGFFLSMLETTKDILIEKNIVSESEYNRYYDKNLKRNFSVQE